MVVNDNGKGHDTIGVAKNSDGSLSIAVADGVSGGVIPKVASRLIVGMALEDMRQTQPLGQILEHAFVEIQATDIPFMARREIQDWETRSRTNPDPIEKTAIDGYIGILKERMEKDDLTATTLGLAKYDRKSGLLQIALKSDTSAHIIHSNGTFSSYQNPDMSQQLEYDPDPNASYTHSAETIRDIQLQPGDLIIIHTDGLKTEAINELSQYMTTLRNSGQRLDTAAMSHTEAILRRTGVFDDVTAAFVYHEK